LRHQHHCRIMRNWRPVAYFLSSKLDPVAAGLPYCLKAVAMAAMAVAARRGLVGYMPLILIVPHEVSSVLLTQKTSHLTTTQFLSFQHVLLSIPNIVLQRCTVWNPATLLPDPEDGSHTTVWPSVQLHYCHQGPMYCMMMVLAGETQQQVSIKWATPLPRRTAWWNQQGYLLTCQRKRLNCLH